MSGRVRPSGIRLRGSDGRVRGLAEEAGEDGTGGTELGYLRDFSVGVRDQ